MSYPLATLGTVATFINGDRGKNYPSKGSFIDEGIPFISAGNLSGGLLNVNSFNYISDVRFDLLSNGKVKNDDILFCLRGSLGKFAVVKNLDKGAIASSLVIIRNNKNIQLSFLKHYLGSPLCRREIDEFENGAAQPNLSAKDLKNFKIPLPPLPEQKKIAEILDAADSLRQKDQQLVEHYDRLSQSLFLDMFGDPVLNTKEWEINEFGDFIEVLTDYHANGSYEILKENVELKRTQDYALMVRTTDLENNNFENDVVYISKSAYEYLAKSKVFGGEIIVSKIGSAGKVFLMPKLDIPVSLGMNAFLLRFSDKLNSLFAYYLLTSKLGEREIGKRIKGAVTKTIRKDALREVPIIVPPIQLQNNFADRINEIDKQKELAQQSLKKSDDLFNSLLQKAFKGELTES